MSNLEPRQTHGETDPNDIPPDGVDAVVPAVHIVLPVAGALLMFLLAFIAIYVA